MREQQRNLAVVARILAQGLHGDVRDANGRLRVDGLRRLAEAVAEEHSPEHPAVAVAWLSSGLGAGRRTAVGRVGGVTVAELRRGFGDEIAGAVVALTPRPGEAAGAARSRIEASPLALIVAAADRELRDRVAEPVLRAG